jgi:hypothetical protein
VGAVIRRFVLALLVLHVGCSDDEGGDDDGQRSATSAGAGSGGSGGSGVGGSGAAISSGSVTGSGGSEDRCPEVCAKLDTVFASFGCTVEECNCKPACADVFEASIDCLDTAGAQCTCNGNELDCGSACQAENTAASDCYQAN